MLPEEHLLHSAGIQASPWAVWALLHFWRAEEGKQVRRSVEKQNVPPFPWFVGKV